MASKSKRASTSNRRSAKQPSQGTSQATTSQRRSYPPNTQYILKEITRRLERVIGLSPFQSNQVFADWLDIAENYLERFPAHIRVIRATRGKQLYVPLQEEPEATQVLWNRLRRVYSETCYTLLCEAATILINDAPTNYYDYLGTIFMSLGLGNAAIGQFFTPWNLALMTAQQTCDLVEAEIQQRIRQALREDPTGQILLHMSDLMFRGAEADDQRSAAAHAFFFDKLLPVALQTGNVKPLRIVDPACGSGVFLLALASCLTPWVVQYGLVQFHGFDISEMCVKMARLNVRLFGLNGTSLDLRLACFDGDDPTLEELYLAKMAERSATTLSGDDHFDPAAHPGSTLHMAAPIPVDQAIQQRKPGRKQRKKQPGDTPRLIDLPSIRATSAAQDSDAGPQPTQDAGLFGTDKAA